MAIKVKRFDPSYPPAFVKTRKGATLGEYEGWIARCAACTAADRYEDECKGCKRLEDPVELRDMHYMVQGGRKASRYRDAQFSGNQPPGAYPPDPKASPSGRTRGGGPYQDPKGRPPNGGWPATVPGTKDGLPESLATKKRLQGHNPLFYARTQPVDVPPSAEEISLAQEIEASIERYRKDGPFVVPRDARLLVEAGMPQRAADILTTRAGGREYALGVEEAARIRLLTATTEIIGSRPVVVRTKNRDHQIRFSGKDALGHVISFEAQSKRTNERGYLIVPAESSLLPDHLDDVDLDSAEGISDAYDLWVKRVLSTREAASVAGRSGMGTAEKTMVYRPAEDDPKFIQALFDQTLTQQMEEFAQANNDPQPRLVIVLLRGDEQKEYEIPYFAREHSKFDEQTARKYRIKYKSLSNVTLDDLPVLLARLASRIKRKGRMLKPLSRINPSMSALVRRNPESPVGIDSDYASLREEADLSYIFKKAYPNAVKDEFGWHVKVGEEGVSSQQAELVPVPGKPGRVFWPVTKVQSRRGTKVRVPVSLKDVDKRQASSWLTIAIAGRQIRPELQKRAIDLYALEAPAATSSTRTAEATRSNPMTDDEYFTRQFGPYGARRAVPVARRNRKSKSKFGKPYAPRDLHPEVAEQFSIVAKLAQAKLAAVPGCDIGEAMRAAWNEHRQTDVWKAYSAKRKAAAKSNPWYDSLYLPDTTIVRSSLVEAPYEYDDPTAVHSDLVPGPYGRTNPADDCIVRGSKRSAKQERARAVTLDQRVLAAEDRESGVAELVPREEERARDFSATGTRHHLDFSPDNQSWPYHPMYEQMDGQFSTGEQFTRGYQPMNRRNPAGDVMTSRFPGKCCICGGEIARGEQMYIHPTMRGPKGGKQKAHVNCGR